LNRQNQIGKPGPAAWPALLNILSDSWARRELATAINGSPFFLRLTGHAHIGTDIGGRISGFQELDI